MLANSGFAVRATPSGITSKALFQPNNPSSRLATQKPVGPTATFCGFGTTKDFKSECEAFRASTTEMLEPPRTIKCTPSDSISRMGHDGTSALEIPATN